MHISLLAQTIYRLDSQVNIEHRTTFGKVSLWQLLPLFKGNKSSPGFIVKKSIGVAVTLEFDQGNVEEMGMNIADISLDSIGEKAQGINRVLISVVNQQEEGEKKKGGRRRA